MLGVFVFAVLTTQREGEVRCVAIVKRVETNARLELPDEYVSLRNP